MGRAAAALSLSALLTALCPGQCAIVADLTAGTTPNNNASNLTSLMGQQLYWSQVLPAYGNELWKWDAQNGAQLVVDLAPGTGGSQPYGLTAACLPQGPRIVYVGTEIGHGTELYLSDGTPSGTGRLKEIRPGSAGSLPDKFTPCGDRVFFQANDGTHGDELWITDGTTAGTQMVLDIDPGSGNGRPNHLVVLNGKLLFSADDPATGRELWCSDGTTAGTQLLKDIRPGASSSYLYGLTRAGDHVYFSANDGSTDTLWRTDGTAAGTQPVPGFPGGIILDGIAACGEKLFTYVFNAPNRGLWVTDGTAAGTIALGGLDVRELTCSGARMFFTSYYLPTGQELYVTDGTLAGTQLVADIQPGGGSSYPERLVDVGTGVVFVADAASNNEIWFSDGTANGTQLVCQPNPGGNYAPSQFTLCDGHLFFQAYDPAFGIEMMWIELPGASTEVVGSSCAPGSADLRLQGGAAPVLGSTVTFEANTPTDHFGVLLAGNPMMPIGVPTVPGLVDGGCDATGLSLGLATTIDVTVSPNWTWSWSVPATPSLEGASLHFQMLYVDAVGGAPLLQLSNGLRLTLGPAAPH